MSTQVAKAIDIRLDPAEMRTVTSQGKKSIGFVHSIKLDTGAETVVGSPENNDIITKYPPTGERAEPAAILTYVGKEHDEGTLWEVMGLISSRNRSILLEGLEDHNFKQRFDVDFEIFGMEGEGENKGQYFTKLCCGEKPDSREPLKCILETNGFYIAENPVEGMPWGDSPPLYEFSIRFRLVPETQKIMKATSALARKVQIVGVNTE